MSSDRRRPRDSTSCDCDRNQTTRRAGSNVAPNTEGGLELAGDNHGERRLFPQKANSFGQPRYQASFSRWAFAAAARKRRSPGENVARNSTSALPRASDLATSRSSQRGVSCHPCARQFQARCTQKCQEIPAELVRSVDQQNRLWELAADMALCRLQSRSSPTRAKD